MTQNHKYAPTIGCLILLLAYSCEKPQREAKVETGQASEIMATTARVTGDIIDLGEGITDHGHCWSMNPTPTIDNSKTQLGPADQTGAYNSNLTNLEAGMKYFVRAYVTNSIGTSYGSVKMFETLPTSVTDYDGNVYQIIQISNQLWMSENLKTTHYSDGTAIPLVEGTSAWDALGYTDKAYCYYDNSTTNGDTYGALYTWAAAMNGAVSSDENPSGVQGVCPTGWHLPGDAEWKELEMFLSMSQAEADDAGWRGTNEGGKLKETGTTHWNSPNTGATNSSGFTALPGGCRFSNGDFANMGYNAYFWSSTELNSYSAWGRWLNYYYSGVYRSNFTRSYGFSVRCLRDE